MGAFMRIILFKGKIYLITIKITINDFKIISFCAFMTILSLHH